MYCPIVFIFSMLFEQVEYLLFKLFKFVQLA